MPSAAAQPLHSSPEDPFEHDSLCSLIPNLFKGLIKQDSIDPFKIQALHLALRQELQFIWIKLEFTERSQNLGMYG
jgi:hypothetical protein